MHPHSHFQAHGPKTRNKQKEQRKMNKDKIDQIKMGLMKISLQTLFPHNYTML